MTKTDQAATSTPLDELHAAWLSKTAARVKFEEMKAASQAELEGIAASLEGRYREDPQRDDTGPDRARMHALRAELEDLELRLAGAAAAERLAQEANRLAQEQSQAAERADKAGQLADRAAENDNSIALALSF